MRVFHERLTDVVGSSLLTVNVERGGVSIDRVLSRAGRDDLCGGVSVSWDRWDALVAAVEENRPVPYMVEN